MEHVLDLDRGDGRTLQRRQEHAPQRITERQAETALQRLGDEDRLALVRAARLLLERHRLLQFLPVLGVDGHHVPLGAWAAARPLRPNLELDGAGRSPVYTRIRRDGAWTG